MILKNFEYKNGIFFNHCEILLLDLILGFIFCLQIKPVIQ